MKMPIVSMNKMAMNESVATTCCYRQVPTATVLYWEVLHGGWVGNGFVEQTTWTDGLTSDAAWVRKLGRDFKLTGDGAWGGTGGVNDIADNYALATINEKSLIVDALTSIPLDATKSNLSNATTLFVGDAALSFYRDCDHSDPHTCEIKTIDQVYANNQHFEATSSHDVKSGQKWNKAHDARQYAS